MKTLTEIGVAPLAGGHSHAITRVARAVLVLGLVALSTAACHKAAPNRQNPGDTDGDGDGGSVPTGPWVDRRVNAPLDGATPPEVLSYTAAASGRMVVLAAAGESDSGALYAVEANGGDWRRLAPELVYDYVPFDFIALTPDSARVVFVTHHWGASLHVVNFDGSALRTLVDHQAEYGSELTFVQLSSSGDSVIFAERVDERDALYVVGRSS